MNITGIIKDHSRLSMMAKLILMKNEAIKLLSEKPEGFTPLYEEHEELINKFIDASPEEFREWAKSSPTTLMAVMCILTQGGYTNDFSFMSKVLKETEDSPTVIAKAKAVLTKKEDFKQQESSSEIENIFS